MWENTNQRICIKFCFKLGKTGTETYEMMKTAFGDEAMSRARVFEWPRRFKEGRQSVKSDPRSGHPSTSRNEDNIAQVKAVVHYYRCLTVREIAEECHISVGSYDEILRKDVNLRRESAKFVPRLLTEDQQFQRLTTSSDLFQSEIDDPEFMKLIITGDKTWVYGYDPETKQQSSQWKTPGSPRPKKDRQVRSKINVMLIVFFDADGIVHHEYAPQDQTVNKEFYLDVMRRLGEAVRRKRPVLWASSRWMLHHDGAPAHTAILVQQFLTKHGTIQVANPPYSPDMSPPDFFLFLKIKNTLKGHRFQNIETIKQNSTQQLQVIPKSRNVSRTGNKYVTANGQTKFAAANGAYFEGD
ncbi:histone-lysine N-methyltransferase SETMAR [Trichonephila clavipes]|nr:histone-lysine N-methyltransferase SETMAR [Trichonephila clavipes]